MGMGRQRHLPLGNMRCWKATRIAHSHRGKRKGWETGSGAMEGTEQNTGQWPLQDVFSVPNQIMASLGVGTMFILLGTL